MGEVGRGPHAPVPLYLWCDTLDRAREGWRSALAHSVVVRHGEQLPEGELIPCPAHGCHGMVRVRPPDPTVHPVKKTRRNRKKETA